MPAIKESNLRKSDIPKAAPPNASACSWKEIPFDEAFHDATSIATKIPQGEFLSRGTFPIIDQGDGFIAGYSNDESAVWRGKLPVVIFGDHTRAIKFVEFPFVLGADGCKVLLPCEQIHPRFAYYYLQSLNLEDAGYSRHFKFLRETNVRYPCDADQERIAGQLEQAERLRRTRRYALELSNTFLPSAFLQLFGDPITNPRAWDRARLCDLGKVETGNTPPREDKTSYGDAVEWIKSDNITLDNLHPTRATEMLSQTGLALGTTVDVGSLLVTCIAGSVRSIGNVVITDRRVAFNQQINAITPRADVVPLFLYGLMLAAKLLIQRSSTEAMKRMITKSKLEELVLIKPPLPLQQHFAALVERVDGLRSVQRESLRQSEHLFASLLHKAFAVRFRTTSNHPRKRDYANHRIRT